MSKFTTNRLRLPLLRPHSGLVPVEILFLFVVAFGVVAPAKAQTPEEIFKLEWKVGSKVIIHGNPILRVEGENKNGVTNIAFINHDQIYGENSERYEKRASMGGKVELFVARRRTSYSPTFYSLIVIIKDKHEKELFRKNLERLRPLGKQNDPQWYIEASVSLPDLIEEPFFVYVIDTLAKEDDKFKFEVTRKVPK